MDNAQIADKLLKIANELRTHPERWTRKALARTNVGTNTAADAPEACQWCAYGFFWREFTKPFHALEATVVWNQLMQSCAAVNNTLDLIGFNDSASSSPGRVANVFSHAAASFEC